MRILFVDPCCPKPYDPSVLTNEAIGGTEATVVRIAEALGAKGMHVRVAQHNRTEYVSPGSQDVAYTPFGDSQAFNPTHVVVLRAPQALRQARKQFPRAKLNLWCHDVFAGPGWADGFQAMVDTQAVPVVVSEWHRMQMYDYMRQFGVSARIPSRRIYNPIADDLNPDSTPVDTNKVVFFSSPHKGLEHTLKVVERFSDFDELKDVNLHIANPGYYPDFITDGIKNVTNLGPLTHPEVIGHVRSALCVLHLNDVFPETFGLVHAEANAVGTPFLSSKIAATPEMADHPGELIDVRDAKAVIDRLIQWKKYGRPKVRGNPAFRTSRIVKEWHEFLSL